MTILSGRTEFQNNIWLGIRSSTIRQGTVGHKLQIFTGKPGLLSSV